MATVARWIRISAIQWANFVLVFAWIAGLVNLPHKGDGNVEDLMMVVLAASAVGGALGFLFAPTGDEKDVFSPFTTGVTGLLAGGIWAELGRSDSFLSKVVVNGSNELDITQSTLISSVAFFTIIPFAAAYIDKKYVLNPEVTDGRDVGRVAALLEHLVGSMVDTRVVGNEAVELASDLLLPGQDDPNTARVLAEVEGSGLSTERLVEVASPDQLRRLAKVYMSSQDLETAEQLLRGSRRKMPDDPNVLFYLSAVLLRNQDVDRSMEAIPYLAYLLGLPSPKTTTWRLHGYACLHVPARREEAIRSLETFLTMSPRDPEASFYLAWAMALKKLDGSDTSKVLDLLKCAVDADAGWSAKLKELTGKDRVFETWACKSEIKLLLPGASPPPTGGVGTEGDAVAPSETPVQAGPSPAPVPPAVVTPELAATPALADAPPGSPAHSSADDA